MNDEPDFDAIKRIAMAYFGTHFDSFLALPPEALVRLMDLAGVERERIGGVLAALSTMTPEEVCRRVLN
jgi:hypothetical protein